MAKNLEENFFEYTHDALNKPRSVFKVGIPHKNSFMSAMFVPLGQPIRVLPGDTWSLNLSGLMRTGSAMVVPPLDDIYLEVNAFWIPDRVIWNHYLQWLGENDVTAWTQNNEYPRPSLVYDGASYDGIMDVVGWSNFALGCHFQLPFNLTDEDENTVEYIISALQARAYYACWNEFIRNPNWQAPVLFSKGDDGQQGEFGYVFASMKSLIVNGTTNATLDDIDNAEGYSYYGVLMPVNKFKDSVTTILPEPQAGDPATIMLLGNAPVVGGKTIHSLVNDLQLGTDTDYVNGLLGINTISDVSKTFVGRWNDGETLLTPPFLPFGNSGDTPPFKTAAINKSNLETDLSAVTAFTINQLRENLLMQEYKELLALGGQRAQNVLYTFFGVKSSSLMHDKPEWLCSKRFRVGVNQIVATADATNGGQSSHLGETGAYSLTAINTDLFTKSMTEHGWILICVDVRTALSWAPQGIPEQFLVLDKFEEYWSVFDHVGNQPFKATVINGLSSVDAIGFQEAWYFYRTNRGSSVGMLDASIPGSLTPYTLAVVTEPFTSENGIGPDFFIQDPTILDRTLLNNYYTMSQFIGDWFIYGKAARVMSPHSDPMRFTNL